MTDAQEIALAKTGICPVCSDAACAVCERCAVCQGHHEGCARAPYYRPEKRTAAKEKPCPS